LAIAVADDSISPTPRGDVDYLRLEVDVGLSAGRNALLRHIATPYFLLLDDDVEFFRRTRIERLLDLVSSGTVDIAAGDYQRCKNMILFTRRRQQPFHGTFQFRDGDLHLVRRILASHPSYDLCDVVHNFFVARTENVLALGGWDEQLKLNEHVEFFVRLHRRGMRVAYCADVVAWHWMERNAEYDRYRGRDFTTLAAQKIGVSRIRRFENEPAAA
jgi:GT2 family glycosyltransferase